MATIGRPLVVMGGGPRLEYFARANAIRAGLFHTAGALGGIGDVMKMPAGGCPPGYVKSVGPTGNSYCITDNTTTMTSPSRLTDMNMPDATDLLVQAPPSALPPAPLVDASTMQASYPQTDPSAWSPFPGGGSASGKIFGLPTPVVAIGAGALAVTALVWWLVKR